MPVRPVMCEGDVGDALTMSFVHFPWGVRRVSGVSPVFPSSWTDPGAR